MISEFRAAIEKKIGRRLHSGETQGLIHGRHDDMPRDARTKHDMYMSTKHVDDLAADLADMSLTPKERDTLKQKRAALRAQIEAAKRDVAEEKLKEMTPAARRLHFAEQQKSSFEKSLKTPKADPRLKRLEPLRAEIAWNLQYPASMPMALERAEHALTIGDDEGFEREVKNIQDGIMALAPKPDALRQQSQAFQQQAAAAAQEQARVAKLIGVEPPAPRREIPRDDQGRPIVVGGLPPGMTLEQWEASQ